MSSAEEVLALVEAGGAHVPRAHAAPGAAPRGARDLARRAARHARGRDDPRRRQAAAAAARLPRRRRSRGAQPRRRPARRGRGRADPLRDARPRRRARRRPAAPRPPDRRGHRRARDRDRDRRPAVLPRVRRAVGERPPGRDPRAVGRRPPALAEGELLQREDAWNVEVTRERYLHRCDLKTARLFQAACRLGALEGGGQAEALGDFGRRIGLAFQLLDDVLDVSGPAERTGKHRGTDLLDGTVTLPFILARERDAELGRARPAQRAHARRRRRRCATRSRRPACWRSRARRRWRWWPPRRRTCRPLPDGQRAALELVADSVADRYA